MPSAIASMLLLRAVRRTPKLCRTYSQTTSSTKMTVVAVTARVHPLVARERAAAPAARALSLRVAWTIRVAVVLSSSI